LSGGTSEGADCGDGGPTAQGESSSRPRTAGGGERSPIAAVRVDHGQQDWPVRGRRPSAVGWSPGDQSRWFGRLRSAVHQRPWPP